MVFVRLGSSEMKRDHLILRFFFFSYGKLSCRDSGEGIHDQQEVPMKSTLATLFSLFFSYAF